MGELSTENIFSRLKCHKELALSNFDIQEAFVLLRQCYYINSASFHYSSKDNLDIITFFRTYNDPLDPNGSAEIVQAAKELIQLINGASKPTKGRLNSPSTPSLPSTPLPAASPTSPQSPFTLRLPSLPPTPKSGGKKLPSLTSTPPTKNPPSLPPTPKSGGKKLPSFTSTSPTKKPPSLPPTPKSGGEKLLSLSPTSKSGRKRLPSLTSTPPTQKPPSLLTSTSSQARKLPSSSPTSSPRTKHIPLLIFPDQYESSLPSASSGMHNPSQPVVPGKNLKSGGHKDGQVSVTPRPVTTELTVGEEIEKKIQLFIRPSKLKDHDESLLREIAEATFNKAALPAMINLCSEYISEGNMLSDELIIKVLTIMEYCLENGSSEYFSMLKDQQGLIEQLKDMLSLRPRLGAKARNILELLGQIVEKQDLIQGSIPVLVELPLPTQAGFSDEFSAFISKLKLNDLTQSVKHQSKYAIGRGGYANVYLATLVISDTRSENVAKKVLLNTFREDKDRHRHFVRLAREMNAWTGLRHPNIGVLRGFTKEDNDTIGLISPYYINGDIVKHIKNNISSGKEFLEIMRGIALGVEYLHTTRIIHGDIKGTNIVMGDDNQPKLIDFGISRIVDVPGFTTTSNATSWAWAAPELLRKDGSYVPKTKESDIYALASTFVEMMTGDRPLDDKIPVLALSDGKTPERPISFKHKFYPGDRLWKLQRSCWGSAESRPKASEVAKFLIKLSNITD